MRQSFGRGHFFIFKTIFETRYGGVYLLFASCLQIDDLPANTLPNAQALIGKAGNSGGGGGG